MKPLTLIKTDPRHGVAVHEAGHGVAAEILGMQLHSVSIVASARGPGKCTLATTVGQYERWKVAVWVAAGQEAEKQFTGKPKARQAEADEAFLHELLDVTRRGDETVEALTDRYEALARALVIEHQGWIDSVARQLLVRKILRADAVRSLRSGGAR